MEVGKRKAHWQKHGHSTWTCEYGTRAHYTINVVHLDGIRDTDMAAIEKLRQAIELIRDSVGELMS
jgi:hypothetical protein